MQRCTRRRAHAPAVDPTHATGTWHELPTTEPTEPQKKSCLSSHYLAPSFTPIRRRSLPLKTVRWLKRVAKRDSHTGRHARRLGHRPVKTAAWGTLMAVLFSLSCKWFYMSVWCMGCIADWHGSPQSSGAARPGAHRRRQRTPASCSPTQGPERSATAIIKVCKGTHTADNACRVRRLTPISIPADLCPRGRD